MYKFILSVLLVPLIPATGRGQESIPVVPVPQDVSISDVDFQLPRNDAAVTFYVSDTSRLSPAIADLKAEWRRTYGVLLKPVDDPGARILIGDPETDDKITESFTAEKIWPDDRIGTEGYVLNIDDQRILIGARTAAGRFYGIQTLRQLVRSGSLGGVRIVDWPDLTYRGMMDDISRGPVPTMAFMKQQVRRCAELKINLMSYYTEHVVKTESHGDFAPAGGSLTIEEWHELSRYAEKYFIVILGNFQSLGHFEKILAYPQYRHLGESHRMLSPAKPEIYDLLADIYSEMIPAFSAPFFNVNCDETWDFGRGATKPLVDSLGIARVYADHILRLYEMVRKYDKRMMIWGDIILEHPEILDMLPKDIIMGAWTYGALDSFTPFFEPFIDTEFEFMFSCGVLNSNRIMPDYRMTVINIRNFARDAVAGGALGMMNTVWDDGGTALFGIDWYGVAYGADHAWNSNSEPVERFSDRFNGAVYGSPDAKIGQALQNISRLTEFTPTQEMNDLILWKTIVPERGERIQLSLQDWDEISEILEETRSLVMPDPTRVYGEDIPYILFMIDLYDYLGHARRLMLGAAQNYYQACFTQTDDRTVARNHLVRTIAGVVNVRETLAGLRNRYQQLWLQENRIYWLDRILAMYQEQLDDLGEAEDLVKSALSDLDRGHYLPPPDAVRMDITAMDGQYFQYWMLCGPFENVRWQGRDVDYLEPMGGEENARPGAGQTFDTPDGRTMRWMKYSSPTFSDINLSEVYEDNTEVLAYAYCRLYSPDKRRVRATLGSNDGIQIFLNGRKVYDKRAKRSLILDEDEVWLDLDEGKNHLLLKIDQNKGEWGFSFRLPDEDVRFHKYKYYIQ